MDVVNRTHTILNMLDIHIYTRTKDMIHPHQAGLKISPTHISPHNNYTPITAVANVTICLHTYCILSETWRNKLNGATVIPSWKHLFP